MNHERRGGLVIPILLVAAGILLLLNTLGIVDWSLWRMLAYLWPILLIAVGLDAIIGRRSTLGSVVVALVTLALIFGSILYLNTGSSGAGPTSYKISQGLEGAASARIEIRAETGSLHLNPLPEGDLLMAGEVQLRQDRRLEQDFQRDGEAAVYRLGSSGAGALAPQIGPGQQDTWDLQLNPEVPTDLSVVSGAGDSTLNLERMALSSLDLKVGVGSATATLPERGQYKAAVKGGIGALRLRVPQGVAARIQATSGLGGVQVDGDFERQGNVYVSPGFETASNRADITINTGIGKVTVETYRGE